VARLVESGVNPGQILLLTFTRKAAEEMLRRAAALGGASCERVAGGTFHSFANLVLRRTARHVGLEPNFTILDRGDSEDVVNLLRSRTGLDRKDLRFPRKARVPETLSMAEIVRGPAASHPNVMAVGDDSQSIYSFRGDTFRNIMDFPKTFPDTRIVKLEDNYRSTQPILDLANAIIDRAAEKHTKVLRTRRAEGPPPLLVQCSDEQAQSRFVCQRILELREEGVPLDEMAVLFRSSFHSF